MGVCLMKTHIRVTIAVLDIDYLVTDNIYARPVAEELFVGRFCIILLRFKELMVKVNIVDAVALANCIFQLNLSE